MPNYEYRCNDCDESVDVQFAITIDKPPTLGECDCGGTYKRVYHSIPTHLKGTGWGSKP